jgi:hypothetical protein
MGTFHQDKHALHGITVVVDTTGAEIFVGRCDDLDDQHVVLLDADVHHEGQGRDSKEAYVARAAQYGVWKKHARLIIPRARVASVRPLGDF